MRTFKNIVTAAACLGALNYCVAGTWGFDAVAWLAGGAETAAARAVYLILGVCAAAALAALIIKGKDQA